MKVASLVVVGLALLVAVRAQDEESQESKDAAEAKEPKASAGPSKLAPTVSYPNANTTLTLTLTLTQKKAENSLRTTATTAKATA